MKKTFTLLTLLTFMTAAIQAQITITVQDIGNSGATVTNLYDITSSNLSIGGSGASQTWDFSAMSGDSLDISTFEIPANTNSAPIFTNANLALERPEDTLFYRVSIDRIEIDGQSGDFLDLNMNIQGDYLDNLTILEFPSTFNDAFTDTALLDSTLLDDFSPISSTTDSGRIKRLVTLSSTMDAWGTITTPAGTYNCIRQALEINTVDSIWLQIGTSGVYTFFIALPSTEYVYRWWAEDEDFPVAEMTSLTQGGAITSAYFKVGDNMVSSIASQENTSCNGDCDGEATAEALSGSGNYTYTWDAAAGNQTTATATGLCAGTYDVTVSDGLTTQVQSVTITEPDLLESSGELTSETGDGFNGAIDIAVVGGSSPYSYNWSGPNGFASTDVDISGLEEGLYEVTITDANGCTTTNSFDLLFNSVELISLNEDLTIFPNPTKGLITIQSGSETPDHYVVLDLLGNMVMQAGKSWNGRSLDLEALPTGLYLIKVSQGEATVTRRVQVIH